MIDKKFVPSQIQYDVTLWGPFLWQSKLLTEITNELAIRGSEVRNVNKNNAEMKLAALMHDEWSYTQNDLIWFSEALNPWIQAYLDTYRRSLGENTSRKESSSKWNLDSLWINYQKQYDFNPPHNHSGSLSFVTYLQVPHELIIEGLKLNGTGPKPGSILFQYGEELPLINNKRVFMPVMSDIFIFPASLVHMVIPFRTPNIERISVSGNITLV